MALGEHQMAPVLGLLLSTRQTHEASGSCLWPGLAPTAVAMWEVNQHKKGLSVFVSPPPLSVTVPFKQTNKSEAWGDGSIG